MDPTKHSKQSIAIQHLNLALAEYVRGVNSYSVLHLAGAAEEMLGMLVKLKNKRSSLERAVDWMQSWWNVTGKDVSRKQDRDRILKIKNGVKHIDGENDTELEADIEYENKEIIRRALENFNQLSIPVTPEILAYHQHVRNNHTPLSDAHRENR